MAKVWSRLSPCLSSLQKDNELLRTGDLNTTRAPFPLTGFSRARSSFPSLSMSCTLLVRSCRMIALEKCAFLGRESEKTVHLCSWKSNKKNTREPSFRGKTFASLPVTGSCSLEIAAALFTFATALVIPIYTVMILAPHWEWTRKLVESSIPYIILGGLYVYLLHASWTSETLSLIFATKHYLPELSGIVKMFSSTLTVSSAWVHLLAGDLFIGRHIFLDGLDHNVETRHSLLLCMIFCPVGLLSHMATKALTPLLRQNKLECRKFVDAEDSNMFL